MMSDDTPAGAPTARMIINRAPGWTFAWFVGRRMVRTAAIWGAVVAVYVYATAVGFDSLGASPSARRATLDVLASNVGLKALLGDSGRVDTVAGFIDWRVIGLMSIATAIWALMAATRWLRGEESAGRWELVLAGPITPRAATARTLTGLGSGVGALWVVAAAGTAIVARRDDVGISPARAAFFATVIAFAPAVFLAVGAVASQLMATRARANSVGATVLGVAFMLRALGDAAPAAHWLVDVSPFGWIEQIHPLGDAHPLWLVPLAGLTAGLGWLAVALAARRDLGDSVIADRDTAPARIRMLSRPTLFAIRMARGSIAAWLGATAIAALLYGAFARSAGQVFADSSVIRKFAGTLAPTAAHLGEQTYAGIIFLLMTTLLMAYASAAMANVRETEAEGYLDNLLVRRVGRLPWLAGRVGVAATVLVTGGILAGAGFWAGAASQHAGLTAPELIRAGINACAPGLLLLGTVVFTFGFLPRATAVVGYAMLAWAFLLEMLGSALHFNHWLMDTSMLHHLALAPTVDPNWRIDGTFLTLGAALAAVGAWRFSRRDLQTG
jgi:ABC-2 type transport system permease protein